MAQANLYGGAAVIPGQMLLELSKQAARQNVNLADPNQSFQRGEGRGDNVLQQVQQRQKEEDAKEQMTKILSGLEQFMTGRGQPVNNMSQMRNMNIQNATPLQEQQTTKPLPFDDMLTSTSNLRGIMNSVDNRILAADEEVRQVADSLTPQMASALAASGTGLYGGVPTNFFENRLNILQQRKRENSVYAFN